MNRKIIISILLAVLTVSLCGCGLTKEEERVLSVITEQAVTYIDEKYEGNHKVKESYYLYAENTCFAAENTGDIMVEFSDGTRVLYDGKGFSDDAQADEIITDLINEIWNPMTECLGTVVMDDSAIKKAHDSWNTSYPRDKYYSVLVNAYELDDVVHGFFFQKYYDGDIGTYVMNEYMKLETYLFHISEEENWKKEVDDFTEEFYRVFGKKRDHYVRIDSVTEEHFKKYRNCEPQEDGFLAWTSLEEDADQMTAEDYADRN